MKVTFAGLTTDVVIDVKDFVLNNENLIKIQKFINRLSDENLVLYPEEEQEIKDWTFPLKDEQKKEIFNNSIETLDFPKGAEITYPVRLLEEVDEYPQFTHTVHPDGGVTDKISFQKRECVCMANQLLWGECKCGAIKKK